MYYTETNPSKIVKQVSVYYITTLLDQNANIQGQRHGDSLKFTTEGRLWEALDVDSYDGFNVIVETLDGTIRAFALAKDWVTETSKRFVSGELIEVDVYFPIRHEPLELSTDISTW